MRINKCCSLYAIASFATLAASAQTIPKNESQEIPSPSHLPEVLVRAFRVPTLMEEASDAVTVVTRADIEKRNPASGVDLFRQIPGLQIDQLGGAGGLSSVYVRGSDPNHVLVLIDGVRVNDPTGSRGGGFDLSTLDPNNVERIEVLRGPASALYGADAMGGVINVVTRAGPKRGLNFTVGGGFGGQGYAKANAMVSGGSAIGRFSLGASNQQDGMVSLGGKSDLTTLNGFAQIFVGSSASVSFNVRQAEQKAKSFPDDSGGRLFSVRRVLDQKQAKDFLYGMQLNWDISRWATLNTSYSRFSRTEDISSAGVAPGLRSTIGLPESVSKTNIDRKNFMANLVLHLPFNNELAIGQEHQNENGTNNTTYKLFGQQIPSRFSLQRTTDSQFVELKSRMFDNLIVRAGIRRDDVSGFEPRTSSSAGIRYNIPAIGSALKANYSEGFKPPSFFALGLPTALGGNPNLVPEHSKGGDIGYEQEFWNNRATSKVSVFQTKYRNLVDFNNATNQLVNDLTVTVKGMEAELTLRPTSSLSLRGHYTRLRTHVVDTNLPLRQRPGVRAGVQVFYDIDARSNFSWSSEFVADVFDSSVPTGNRTLPSYARTDIAYSYQIRKWVTSSVAVDNLFNRRYESFTGFVNPGIRLRVGLMAAF